HAARGDSWQAHPRHGDQVPVLQAREPQVGGAPVSVLITLTDVEPAVRLNALLERHGVATTVVSPMDDVNAALRKAKPRVIVLTGALMDAANLALVREQLWAGAAVVGLADIGDPV